MSEQDIVFIARDMRKSLDRYTEKARVRGDFIEAMLAMHSGLDRIFELHWDPTAWHSDKDPSFVDRAKQVIPWLEGQYSFFDMNQKRNDCAHPGPRYYTELQDDETIREIAESFVELALAVWPKFLPGSPPGVVHQPVADAEDVMNATQVAQLRAEMERLGADLDSTKRKGGSLIAAAKQKDGRIQELKEERDSLRSRLRPKIPSPELPDLPWRQLAMGLLLLLPVPLLLSLALHLWATIPGAWAWPLAAGAATLVLCFFGLLNLARFLRAMGLLRLVAILSVALILATLLVLPATDSELPWADRGGSSMTVVLDSLGDGVYAYTSVCADWGGELADFIVSSADASTPTVEPRPSTIPTATRRARATSTATVRPTSTATRSP